MKAGQVWQDQKCPLHTIVCVVDLGMTFGFPFNGSAKGTKLGDSRSIVDCQMGI